MRKFPYRVAAVVFGLSFFLSAGQVARATISVNASDSFSDLSIDPASGTVSFSAYPGYSGTQTSAYGQAGGNTQYGSTSASATDVPVAGGTATGAGTGSASSGTASATGFIPGAVAGYDTSEGQGSVSGVFEIVENGGIGKPSVSVTLSALFSDSLALSADAYGVSGRGETVLSVSLDGTPVLFSDTLLTIGPDQTANQTSSSTMSDTMTLMANTPYYLYAQADAESDVVNSTVATVPEPAVGALLSACLVWSGMVIGSLRQRSRKKAGNGMLMLFVGGAIAGLALPMHAMYVGSDPPNICKTCGTQPTQQPGGTGYSSISEGNNEMDYSAVTVNSAYGPTLPFALTYNSYNADGSKAQLDTGMGFGWTHNYNAMLFQQRGQMFRLGTDGRVTQYFMNYSSPGTYASDAGYFETMTMQSDGSFIITNKNQSWWHFGTVANSPFLIQGPVYQLLQTGDRNNNVTTMSYNSSGLLSTVTDPFGRTLQFTYNSGNHLTSVTDPLGRTTLFQYDPSNRVPTQITDPQGNITQYTYNSQYQITRKVDRDGRMYFYTYKNQLPFMVTDGSGQPYFSMTNPTNWSVNSTNLAFSLRRQYNPSTTTSTDGRGNLWQYAYDTNGYITNVVAPDSTTTKYTYDPATHLVSSITDPNGNVTRYQYDGNGNRTNITDAMGNVTRYTYDPVFSMITSMTDPNGRTWTYTYDGNGNRLTETDPIGDIRKWSYDVHGNVTSSTDQNGYTTTYQFDSYGNPAAMTDPLSDVTIYHYDADGDLISTTDALGRTTTYTYDALNRLIGMTNALGGVSTMMYDGYGRQTRVTDPNTNVTSYGYDIRGRPSAMTNAIGGVSSTVYDANDNRITTTDPLGYVNNLQYDTRNRLIRGTNNIGGVIQLTYDAYGNRLTETDPNTNTTVYTYDALNRKVTMTDALGGVTTYDYATTGSPSCCAPSIGSALVTEKVDPDGNVTFYQYDELNRRYQTVAKNSDTNDTINPGDAVTTTVYDPAGNVLTVTDPSTNTTTFTYDALERRILMIDAAGDVTSRSYDPVGNVETITAANNNITTNVYDGLNRAIAIYDAIGMVRTTTYDPDGNALSRTDGLGDTTSYTYDGLNRLVTVTDALGKTSSTAYDADSNMISTTDRDGHTTLYVYDGLNRRISVTDPLGHTSVVAYDADNNKIQVTDANGHATIYMYDALNRKISETYPDTPPNTRTMMYDPAGNLIRHTDQLGQVITYSYNHLYYMTNRSYSPSGSMDIFTYDPGGRMLTATRNGWVESFAYDGANRMTNSTQNGRTFNYTYNPPGRVRTNTEPSGRVLIYTYDARNRLITLQDGTTNLPIATYTYDDAGRVVSRTYRNGTTAAYDYNADNWVTSINHSNETSLIAGFDYAYDNEGNRLDEQKLDSLNNSSAYAYDAANRLTNYDVGALSGSTVPSPSLAKGWNLDALGNWTSTVSNGVPAVRTFGPANELLTENGSNYVYDADGNLSQDLAYKYSYDEEHRLIQVQRLSDSAIVGQYQYDALSRRILEVTNPASVLGTNLFYYDGARLMEVWDGNGTQTAAYTYGNYIDETLTMDRGGLTYYYHQNAIWSPGALTDASGNPVERYTYDVYGAVTVLDGSYNPLGLNSWGTPHSAVGNPWLFTGRQLDEEDGLYCYRARYYDDEEGRFLQRDPMEYVSSLNLYEYVRSEPADSLDPSGMVDICAGAPWTPVSIGKGLWQNRKKDANYGFFAVGFSITPELSLQACTHACCAKSKNAGKQMEDFKGTISLAAEVSVSLASWGGGVDLGPVRANAWLGVKGTLKGFGKISFSVESDSCNNVPFQGTGCATVGVTGTLEVGGEVNFSVGWFDFNNGVTGSASVTSSWGICATCKEGEGCKLDRWKFQGATLDFQIKGCIAYFGCVGSGFSVPIAQPSD